MTDHDSTLIYLIMPLKFVEQTDHDSMFIFLIVPL
jgi:hypothetical protein